MPNDAKGRGEEKERLLFIDSGYRRKTRSVDFLLSLLGERYDVDVFYIEEASAGEIAEKGRGNYRAVVFLQINPAYFIDRFKGQNIVFVPMYDTFTLTRRRHLLFLKKVKWLCFTEKYRPFLRGVDALYVKYYPEPHPIKKAPEPNTFFFWQRRAEIDWPLVKKLLGHAKVEAVNLHASCDPGVSFTEPSEADRARYNIDVTTWFDSKVEYEDRLGRYAYFFAPRGKEGIGLSFLDAMAMGLVVIAPNEATMNEYITDGVNGYLYDIDDPRPIDFSEYDRIRERSIRDATEGYAAWRADEKRIFDFIESPHRKTHYPINKGTFVDLTRRLAAFRGARPAR